MNRYTIKEISQSLGVSPADALELVRGAGITEFCWEGETFSTPRELVELFRRTHRYDPVPELDFEATPAQVAAILEPEISQAIADLRAEAFNNDSIDSSSPNLRRLFACGRLLAGQSTCA